MSEDSSPVDEERSADWAGLFEDIKTVIREHFYFEQEWHYTIAALFVLECAVFESLPAVFYLFFPGSFGTGKTNILGLIATLTDSVSLENVSVAALAHELGDGRPVCIDEYDVPRGKDIDEVRNALVRQGYKRKAAPYTRHDPVKKVNERIPIFGPKALTFRGSIEQALQSRGYPIPTVRVKGKDGYRYVLNNLYPHVQALPRRIADWGRMARATFSEDTLEAMARSPEVEDEVKAVCNELGANRSTELATVAVLVAHMAGLDVVADLKKANELNELETAASEPEDKEELLEVLQNLTHLQMSEKGELVLEEAKVVRHRQREIFETLNRLREQRQERRMTQAAFASLRRDLGVRDEWLGSHANAKYWNLPIEWVKENLLALSPETQRVSSKEESQEEETRRGPNGRPPDALTSVVTPVVPPLDLSPLDVVDKLRGGRNIRAISDHIRMKLRWNSAEPDSWITRDTVLALQLPEDSQEDVEAFVGAMRLGMEP